MRMRHIVICGLPGSTYLRHDFRKTAIEHKLYVMILLKLLPETFLILRGIQ
jgi:hypothetical protein